jgi:diguanylate cyclase (GGDEF)-like protein
MAANPTVGQEPEREHRRSFLMLRWLLVILAAYLTLFSHLQAETFNLVCVFVALFAASNLAFVLLPRRHFPSRPVQLGIVAGDVLFVSLSFYLLRVTTTYLHLAFILIFVLIAVWRDLRVVALSLLSVSLLYGLFKGLELVGMLDAFPYFTVTALALGEDMERFLTLSLFFVVSIFYLFLADCLRKLAHLSAAGREEQRRAEIMAEIARSVTSSLDSREILHLIVTRLCEVFGASHCSIVRQERRTARASVLARSGAPDVQGETIEMESYPELQQANESRELVFSPDVVHDGIPQSVVAVPMLGQDSVLGVIHARFQGRRSPLSEADERFLKMMSSTAGTALRNAQLYEEMAHRARTDFLTDLPNHRHFQSTLSHELDRAKRHNHPLSLLIIDLDYLKDVNDKYGHPTGDVVIRTAGNCIRKNCRDIDFAARYGGEEFTVILPETPLTGAIEAAERIRHHIKDMPFPGIGTITASIGVSNYPVNALDKEDLIRAADKALYRAKGSGRDRVEYVADLYSLVGNGQ